MLKYVSVGDPSEAVSVMGKVPSSSWVGNPEKASEAESNDNQDGKSDVEYVSDEDDDSKVSGNRLHA